MSDDRRLFAGLLVDNFWSKVPACVTDSGESWRTMHVQGHWVRLWLGKVSNSIVTTGCIKFVLRGLSHLFNFTMLTIANSSSPAS